jgi:hypothetical protein
MVADLQESRCCIGGHRCANFLLLWPRHLHRNLLTTVEANLFDGTRRLVELCVRGDCCVSLALCHPRASPTPSSFFLRDNDWRSFLSSNRLVRLEASQFGVLTSLEVL